MEPSLPRQHSFCCFFEFPLMVKSPQEKRMQIMMQITTRVQRIISSAITYSFRTFNYNPLTTFLSKHAQKCSRHLERIIVGTQCLKKKKTTLSGYYNPSACCLQPHVKVLSEKTPERCFKFCSPLERSHLVHAKFHFTLLKRIFPSAVITVNLCK